jgi:hypothetical protein
VLLLLSTPLALMAHVPALLAWLAAGWYAFAVSLGERDVAYWHETDMPPQSPHVRC